jgi:hypothetical protein
MTCSEAASTAGAPHTLLPALAALMDAVAVELGDVPKL